MKPKLSSVFSRLVPLALLVAIPTLGQPVGDLAAHRTEEEVTDSLKKALPFLEDKVASTIVNGASTPIAFHGEVQFRSYFHNYYNLADSSSLSLAEQGFKLGGDEPLIKLGMIITPNRNTVMYAKAGFSASYQGVNQKPFLNPSDSLEDGYSFAVTHHNANKSVGIMEDMSAGIAIRTAPASFQLQMGAMNWNEASPLSIWKAQPRMFAWEYLPYEVEAPIAEYYRDNIAKGEKTGRAAWNKKPFQGIDFKITDLPGDIKGYFMYGFGQPYDRYQRNAMDMAVDLGYAGDEGAMVETGIADSYRKHMFYRINKKFMPELTVGFNNGYIFTSSDITSAGFKYDYLFNNKFDIGLYNSVWKIGNEEITLNDKASFDAIIAGAGSESAISIGEGYWLEPKYYSVDFRGNIGSKFSYMADIGFSSVDTTFVQIQHSDQQTVLSDGTFSKYETEKIEDGGSYVAPGKLTPGSIESIRNGNTWGNGNAIANNAALFLEMTYHSKVNVTVDMMYAGNKFNSPYSFIADMDAFFARGSNLIGPAKFLGNEASPYTSNMFATGVTVKPEVPWYGHLKVKYGINSQLSAGRDVLFFPYRLNGSSVVASFNNYFSKWGLGKVTETYDFNYNQHFDNPADDGYANHAVSRIGDESYGSYIGDNPASGDAGKYGARTILSPSSGGMRADAHSLYEGFVPYTDPTDVIFNHFAKSSLVQQDRDLSQIWNDTLRQFVDVRNNIKDIRIVDGSDTTYYSMNDNSNTLGIANAAKTDTVYSVVKTTSSTGFVPVSQKSSFNFAFDWALDLGKYVGYNNDLFLSMYYEVNGVTRSFKPLAFDSENEDVMMMSHYIRTEPAIAITPDFYVLGLFGWERWIAGTSWLQDLDDDGNFVGFSKQEIKTTDIALGLGFDWDFAKRVGFHGRYKWFTHSDESISSARYNSHAIAFELKAYF